MLDVGTPCWISGPTGAAMYGADGFRLEPPFHLLLPRDRRASRVNAIVHTTTSIDRLDTVVRHGLPVLSASRLVIDLASTESSERLTTALDCFLRDGFTAEDFLHAQINRLRSSGRYGIPQLLDVIGGIELSRGGHSWLERRYLQLIGEAGLPRPLTQQVLTRAHDRVVRVDCHFPGTPLIVELLGYKWHRTREQMGRDAERITALQLTGYVVAQFTYAHIATDPAWVVDTTREAYTLCSAAA